MLAYMRGLNSDAVRAHPIPLIVVHREEPTMPTVGQEIINPVAGDAVRFLALPGEDRTDLVMEMKTVPAGQGPPVHIHPRSHETFTVVRGSIVVHENGREVVLHAGETHTVRPGVPHGFASHGDREAVTRVTMDRPGRMAEFLETYYELNRAGRTDAEGKPSFPQIAVTFGSLRADIRTVVAPWPAQLALFAALGPMGRLRGLKPFYVTDELRPRSA
jgi:quercetin dioxygenase-like cupin family protein